MTEFRAIIPAAGIGKRMRPLTHTRPKVLLPIAGKPIIGHLISDLVQIGIRDITIVVGYFGEKVEEYCTRAFPEVNFRFRWQGERLGLGHAVGEAIAPNDQKLLIVLGDTLFKGNLDNFKGNDALLGLVKVEDPRRFGVAVVEDDKIVDLDEKPEHPKSDLALSGIYYLPDAQVLKAAIDTLVEKNIKTRGEYQITDALQLMIDDNATFRPVELEGWYDCGMPESLVDTNRVLFDMREELNSVPSPLRKTNLIIEPVSIDPSADVRESVIGPYVHIGPEAKVRRCIISDSIIDAHADLHGQHFEETVLGQNVQIRGKGEPLLLGDDCIWQK